MTAIRSMFRARKSATITILCRVSGGAVRHSRPGLSSLGAELSSPVMVGEVAEGLISSVPESVSPSHAAIVRSEPRGPTIACTPISSASSCIVGE